MKKEDLLSIGDLALRTGVSIKSLRYYDKIGILKPKYIDPDTNYRYYSYEQARIVDIIQLFIWLGVPLKDVKILAMDKDNNMNFKELIGYGRNLAEEQILKLKKSLQYLNTIESEINRSESYRNDEYKRFLLNEKYCYVLPYYENTINKKFYLNINNIYHSIIKENLDMGYDFSNPYFEVRYFSDCNIS